MSGQFPVHFLGLAGTFQRIPDYSDAFGGWSAIALYGSYLSVLGATCLLCCVRAPH